MSERFLCGVFSYRIMREEKEEGREMGEEKEEGREEEEVPEGFLEAVNKFCDAYVLTRYTWITCVEKISESN